MHHILLYLGLSTVSLKCGRGGWLWVCKAVNCLGTNRICAHPRNSLAAQFIARVSTLHSGTSTKPEFWRGYLKKGFGHVSAQ